jgi:RNA polymerase sigma-70 factor (ECF subfamily)
VPANEFELKSLMLAGLDGKATAHRALLDRLSRHLRAYYKARLPRIGRSASEAEDLIQEALLAIHTHRHTYDPREPFTPWVYAIARYKLVDHLRRTRAASEHIPIEDAGALIADDDQVNTESAFDLERLLSRLPAKMQQSIAFVKVEGLSVAEAARRSGMSESAIKINIHRGLKALAALIAREKHR